MRETPPTVDVQSIQFESNVAPVDHALEQRLAHNISQASVSQVELGGKCGDTQHAGPDIQTWNMLISMCYKLTSFMQRLKLVLSRGQQIKFSE